MKIEKPPITEINVNYLIKIWEGEYEDFLNKSDEKYYYWDDLKYKKDSPFSQPIENWTLLKTYRLSKYVNIEFGKHKFNYFISSFIAKKLT